jgi:hypothetical protein
MGSNLDVVVDDDDDDDIIFDPPVRMLLIETLSQYSACPATVK